MWYIGEIMSVALGTSLPILSGDITYPVCQGCLGAVCDCQGCLGPVCLSVRVICVTAWCVCQGFFLGETKNALSFFSSFPPSDTFIEPLSKKMLFQTLSQRKIQAHVVYVASLIHHII